MPIKEFRANIRTFTTLELTIPTKVTIDLALLSSQFVGGQGLRFDIEEDFVREAQSNRMPLLAINNFAQFNFPYLSQFEVSASGNRFRDLLSTTLLSNWDTEIAVTRARFLLPSELTSTFQLTGALRINPTINATLAGTFAQTVNASATFTNNEATLNTISGLTAIGTVTPALEGIQDGIYLSNTDNEVTSGMGIVDIPDFDQSSDIYTFTLSSPNGEFGDTTSSSPTYTDTGSLGLINFRIENAKFYPTPGFAGNTTVTLTVSKQGSYTVSEQFGILNVGDGRVTRIVEFDQDGTLFVNYSQRTYNVMDYIVVGGGGAGARPGGSGGGAAGVFRTATNQTIVNNSYSVIVGSGGSGTEQLEIGVSGGHGNPGNDSSFNQLVASGGLGGRGTLGNADGGDGGDNADYVGGIGYDADPADEGAGGGGAGSSSNGSNPTGSTGTTGGVGGSGTSSSITGSSTLYAQGGYGGYGSVGSPPTSQGPERTTAGSGGRGESIRQDFPTNRTDGLDGIVVVKIY